MMKIKLILDNKGRTFDRYSVIFTDGSFLSLSSNCDSQRGEWQEIPPYDKSESTEEIEISFADLPISVQQHIKRRMKE